MIELNLVSSLQYIQTQTKSITISSPPIPIPMSQTSIFDLSKLSSSSIRKYQSYFSINCTDEDLKQKVKQHFEKELKIESNQVIDRFLQLKREDKDKKGGRARNARMPPV